MLPFRIVHFRVIKLMSGIGPSSHYAHIVVRPNGTLGAPNGILRLSEFCFEDLFFFPMTSKQYEKSTLGRDA